ncbi:MAG: zinc ribbon domain-containing protein [Pseudomonadota bacterium]
MTLSPAMARLAEKAALEEGLWLHQCAACGALIWPLREVCPACLAIGPALVPVSPEARVLSTTVVRASLSPQMAQRLPLPLASVLLAPGATGLAFAAGPLSAGDTVTVTTERDPSGTPVLLARPAATPLAEALRTARLVGPAGAVRLVGAPDGMAGALGALGHVAVEEGATAAVVWCLDALTLEESGWAAFEGLAAKEGPAPVVMVHPFNWEAKAAPLRAALKALAARVMPKGRVVLLLAGKEDAQAISGALCTTREVVAAGVPIEALAPWWCP